MQNLATPTQKLYFAIFNCLPEQDLDETDLPDLLNVLNALSPREAEAILKQFGITHDKMPQTKIAAAWEVDGRWSNKAKGTT